MSHDEPTPERLDAILDGREPAETDTERDMLALAGSMKDASPPASEALRARVRALPAPKAGRVGPRRLAPRGWGRRALVGAPVLAAAIAAVVAVGVLNDRPGGTDSAASGGDASTSRTAPQGGIRSATTPSAAPGVAADSTAPPEALSATPTPSGPAPVIRVPPGRLEQALARAEELVRDSSGAVTTAPEPGAGGVRLTITSVPDDRGAGLLAGLGQLGEVPAGLAMDTDGQLVIVLAESP